VSAQACARWHRHPNGPPRLAARTGASEGAYTLDLCLHMERARACAPLATTFAAAMIKVTSPPVHHRS